MTMALVAIIAKKNTTLLVIHPLTDSLFLYNITLKIIFPHFQRNGQGIYKTRLLKSTH